MTSAALRQAQRDKVRAGVTIAQMDGDPITAVRNVTIPMLFILASNDPWIPVKQTEAKLRQLSATHPRISLRRHTRRQPPDDAAPRPGAHGRCITASGTNRASRLRCLFYDSCKLAYARPWLFRAIGDHHARKSPTVSRSGVLLQVLLRNRNRGRALSSGDRGNTSFRRLSGGCGPVLQCSHETFAYLSSACA